MKLLKEVTFDTIIGGFFHAMLGESIANLVNKLPIPSSLHDLLAIVIVIAFTATIANLVSFAGIHIRHN